MENEQSPQATNTQAQPAVVQTDTTAQTNVATQTQAQVQTQAPAGAASQQKKSPNKALIIAICVVAGIIVLTAGFFFLSTTQKKNGKAAIDETLSSLTSIGENGYKISEKDAKDSLSNSKEDVVDELLASLDTTTEKLDKAQGSLNKAKNAQLFLDEKDKKLVEDLQSYINEMRTVNSKQKVIAEHAKENLPLLNDMKECMANIEVSKQGLAFVVKMLNSSSDAAGTDMVRRRVETTRYANSETKKYADKLKTEYKIDTTDIDNLVDNVSKACDAASAICNDIDSQNVDAVKQDVDAFNNARHAADLVTVQNNLSEKVRKTLLGDIEKDYEAFKNAKSHISDMYKEMEDAYADTYSNVKDLPSLKDDDSEDNENID